MPAGHAVGLKKLSPSEKAQYGAAGHVFPIAVLTPGELSAYQAHLRDFLASDDWPLTPATRLKPHLYLKWVNDLVCHPAVLDAVEDILGPDLLVWFSILHFKPARGPAIDWHRDTVYRELDRDEVVTVWIALTDSTEENGCVQFDSGSHVEAGSDSWVGGRKARPTQSPVSAVLRAGEASLHDLRIRHGSLPNRTDEHRCGVVARYFSAERVPCRRRAAATLVRGADRFARFDLEPAPRFDHDPLTAPWQARYLRERSRAVLWTSLTQPRRLRTAARMLLNRSNLRFFWRSIRQRVTQAVTRRRDKLPEQG